MSEPPRRPQCHDPIAPDSPATTTLVQVSELNLMEMFTLKMNSFGLINIIMDVRIREEHSWSGQRRYMVEAKQGSVEGGTYWLPLGAFLRSTWQSHGVGRHYNIQVNVRDDKWINVEHVELST
jgi:hypothetical protein